MIFIALLVLSTLAIAGSAAFFSIYGLAQVFAGAFWPVVFMAASLEAGKLVAASYLYRYWKVIGFLRKTYLSLAILVLMAITSAGIFGFLSGAYQQDVLPLEEMKAQIVQLDQRKAELEKQKEERVLRRQEINKQINDLPSNYATKRQQVRLEYKPELEQIASDLHRFDEQIRAATDKEHELKTAVIQQKVHTGPIIFIAKALGQEIDDATKYMIFLIIFAFDPLAVALTVGANDAILQRKGGRDYLLQLEDEGTKGVTPLPSVNALGVEDLEAMLDAINSKHDQTPEVQLQKTMVEEMLARKRVTERVRNPQRENP